MKAYQHLLVSLQLVVYHLLTPATCHLNIEP
jgi:hypothetical protein